MSLLQLVNRIIGKKAKKATTEAASSPRQDEELPLGARIGGLIEVPRASFLVRTGTLAKAPADSQLVIEAISSVHIKANEALKLYRFYTAKGDAQTEAGQAFLQIFVQEGKVVEAAYYQHLYRLIPTTQEEQDAYQGNGYGLGELAYTMDEDQLALCGCTESELAEALAGEPTLTFYRDTPDASDYVKPYVATEVRIDDPAGIDGMKQSMHMMPYRRVTSANDDTELLLISFEVVESVNGVRAPAVHVDFMVGTPIDVQKIKII